jgi:hypothetical protein
VNFMSAIALHCVNRGDSSDNRSAALKPSIRSEGSKKTNELAIQFQVQIK